MATGGILHLGRRRLRRMIRCVPYRGRRKDRVEGGDQLIELLRMSASTLFFVFRVHVGTMLQHISLM